MVSLPKQEIYHQLHTEPVRRGSYLIENDSMVIS